jgi:L-fucose isomerase-like protein
MSDQKKLKIGIANLMMLNIFGDEAEKKARNYFDGAVKFLEDELGVEVHTNLQAVTNLDEARQTWEFFAEKRVEAIILFNGTFSLTNLMIEIIRNSNVPFVIWGFEEYLMDKKSVTGSMIGLMPAGMVFRNLDKKFSFVYGSIERREVQDQLKVLFNVIKAVVFMREAKIGLIGSRPDGFEIANYDELVIKKIFGTTLTKIDMSYYLNLIDSIDDGAAAEDVKAQKKVFDLKDTGEKEAKELSKIYLATKKIIEDNKIQCYAPQCWPELRMERQTPLCSINSRITAEGTMASCEADIDCGLTMLLFYSLTGGTSPWTADFVNYIEKKDAVLYWHCGNAPFDISDGKPLMEVVYEGPALTASTVKGVATVCRLNHFRGGFEIYAGVGEVIKSEPLLRGSNMLINMRGGNMEYIKWLLEKGVPHHNVVVYGDLGKELIEFGNILDIPVNIFE